MDTAERQKLVAKGVMDDEHDAYPRICEGCPAEYPGSASLAMDDGWVCSWDGWLCPACK